MLADVVADGGDTVAVTVEFKLGGPFSNTYAALQPEDELRVVAGDETTVLSETVDGTYGATVEAPAPGTVVRLVLVREDHEGASAQGSLPAPFDFSSAPDGETLSRTEDPIELAWSDGDPADTTMVVEVFSEGCFALERRPVVTPGSLSLAAGALMSTEPDTALTCTGTVAAKRTRLGEVDAALAPESVFRLQQVRTRSFTSEP